MMSFSVLLKSLNYSQYLIKSERLVPQKFTFYFAGKADTLPVLKGLNFDEKDAFVIEKESAERYDPLLGERFSALQAGYAGYESDLSFIQIL